MDSLYQFDLENADDDIADLTQEIAILSECRHVNVTEHYISFFKGTHLWIVMEYLDYGSCSDWVKITNLRSEEYIAVILREVLTALVYIHDCNLIHRDIKAANILLSTKGEVKLADFGVSARVEEYHAIRHTFVGTPLWMAPEVINTHLSEEAGYNSKIDVWSLGITAIELGVGEPPYAGASHARSIIAIGAKPAPRLPADFSLPFQSFVAACLVKDPRNRPSARDLLEHEFIRNATNTALIRQLCMRYPRWKRDASGFPVKPSPALLSILADKPVIVEEEDDGWDFNSTVKTLQDLKLSPPTAPKDHGIARRQSMAAVPFPSVRGSIVKPDAASMKPTVSEQVTVRSHRRTTSNTEIRITGRKSLEPTRPSRPQTANNHPSGRQSLGLREYGKEGTIKATSFGRPLASNEVNARVAGHRAGRAQDSKPRATTNNEKARAEDVVGGELPTARPQPASSSSHATRPSRPSTGGQRRNTLERQPSAINGQENDPFVSGFKTAAPHDFKGFLGRAAFDSVVKLSLEELYLTLAPGKKRDVLKNMAKAWAELDAISPELELSLLRKIGTGLARLQTFELVVFGGEREKRCGNCQVKFKDTNCGVESRPGTASDVGSDKSEMFVDFKQEEYLARERRLAYLEKNNAEPLFATTRNEQLKNQHWKKAARSPTPAAENTRDVVSRGELSEKGSQEFATHASKESVKNLPPTTTMQITPVKETPAPQPPASEDAPGKRKERLERRKTVEPHKIKRVKEEPALRAEAMKDKIEVQEEAPKRRGLERRSRQQGKSSSDEGISEREDDARGRVEDESSRPVAIDKTPATPKIERKRKPTAPVNPQSDFVEVRAAPARTTAPSPVKLYSPRTRLRQALMSDDESSPPPPKTSAQDKSQTKLPEGARTPLMQKRISQLRSPDQHPDGKPISGDMGDHKRDNEQGKNRLGFARRVEYAETPESPEEVQIPSDFGPLPVRRESRPNSGNARPRAKSSVSTAAPPPQLPTKLPGRKRSQSNLGTAPNVDAINDNSSNILPSRLERLSSPAVQDAIARSRPPLTRVNRTTPNDMFGPELVPARRLERPILRPSSQPSGKPPARLGRPFTAHASAPVIGTSPMFTKEQNKFSRSTTERHPTTTTHNNKEVAEAPSDGKDPVYITPPTRGVFLNL
ncbi:hypothetical protein AA313_de0200724 [Arthrobotrys entomopaga]|nr:hypothetical protein AA313_de0200724 [Arthrobotrys entomopaga]